MNETKAFSLVELLVVTAIIAIITATIGVALWPASSRRVNEEAAKLANQLRWVRDFAVVNSTNYTVDFDYNNDSVVNATDENRYLVYQTADPNKIIAKRQLEVDKITVQRRYIDDMPSDATANVTNSTFIASTGTVEKDDPDGNPLTYESESTIIGLDYRGYLANVTVFSQTGYVTQDGQ